MMRTLILLLALASMASASCVSTATDTIMSEQGVFIGVVIMLMVVVIAFAYMFGTALNYPNFVVFAKDEMYHLGFSVLLLVSFSAIMVFSCNLTQLFFDETFGNLGTSKCYFEGRAPMDVAECYVGDAKNDARSLSERYIQKYIDNMMDSTFAVSLAIPLMTAYTATAGAYRRVVASQYNMIFTTFLVPALMSISMQKFVLLFIDENVIQWILPVAFLLRFFPLTRHMGNIFIAVAVALYVLVPMLYAFNMAMYDVTFRDCNSFARAACDFVIDGGGCESNPATTCSNPDSLWNIARLIPQAFFLPNLTIALVITFLGSIHKALRVIG